ncbi:hypothetical protein [Homoserinimonas sp. OAct 916]|uniref:hypothetical protein n=1 Tax=Homoserinimonas sp. OAct 916 TaxID=2211450 RepID=UPI001300450B|nr:hypothetical protein [Homoserinimonas sp. OAct 916]
MITWLSILGLSVGAVFAFPLVMGSAAIGVVDLYRLVPGALDGYTAPTGSGLPFDVVAGRI